MEIRPIPLCLDLDKAQPLIAVDLVQSVEVETLPQTESDDQEPPGSGT